MFQRITAAAASMLLATALAGCASRAAPGTDQDGPSVALAAERLRIAMIDPTPEALGQLVADELSYGHSGGRVDTKASFIGDLMNGKSDFVTIVITDQSIQVVDGVALVRHTLTADTNDSGKPGRVQIKVLGVWQKRGNDWKLLARQAVRPA